MAYGAVVEGVVGELGGANDRSLARVRTRLAPVIRGGCGRSCPDVKMKGASEGEITMDDIVINSEGDLKSVAYRLVRNEMASQKAGAETYVGQVEVKETYGLQDVAEQMVKEGCAQMVKEGCAVKKSTIRLVLSEFAEMVAGLVAAGRAVNIGGLVRFAPAVRGTFASEDAAWDPSKNKVVVNATVGSRLRTAAASSTVRRLDAVDLPTLEEVIDLSSQEHGKITSLGSFLVQGSKLSWNAEAEDEGFFVIYNTAETACEAVLADEDPTRVILRNKAEFASNDEEIGLVFRTRMGGESLFQVTFKGELKSRVAEA